MQPSSPPSSKQEYTAPLSWHRMHGRSAGRCMPRHAMSTLFPSPLRRQVRQHDAMARSKRWNTAKHRVARLIAHDTRDMVSTTRKRMPCQTVPVMTYHSTAHKECTLSVRPWLPHSGPQSIWPCCKSKFRPVPLNLLLSLLRDAAAYQCSRPALRCSVTHSPGRPHWPTPSIAADLLFSHMPKVKVALSRSHIDQ